MSVPWLFLAVSVWGAVFTANALWPPRRPWPILGLSFFPAWLTTELALHHLLWQAVATAIFVGAGALDEPAGWIALAVTITSWVGLGTMVRTAHRSGAVARAALDDVLGTDHRDRLDPRWQEHLRPGIAWRKVLLPFPVRARGVTRVRNLAYAPGGSRRHRLDVWHRADVADGAPVLLQIHGGGWMIGTKDQQGLPLMTHLAERGWVCVAINYRLSPRATWPDHLVDCKRALAWIREHIAEYGGDPDFVAVTGGSAGGHLTAMMALTQNEPRYQPGFEQADTSVQAFVPFYGVFDFTDRHGIRGARDPLRRALERRILKARWDDAFDDFDAASPMSLVRDTVPPAMVVHGDRDTLAPVEEARRFVAQLREASTDPVVYVEFSGAHHAFELFPSIRALHAIHAVEVFLAWVASRVGEPPPDAGAAGDTPPGEGPVVVSRRVREDGASA